MANINKLTSGNPLKLILKFALPILAGNLFQQVYAITDSVIVGQYVGKDAFAAVGSTGSLTFLIFSICIGISIGIGIIVSQFFGAGNEKMVKKSIANGFTLALAISAVMTVVTILLSRPLLVLLNTPDAIIADATTYMQISAAGIVVITMYNTVAEMLRALGDSRTPLIFLIVSASINIGLDFLFILGFNMGVAGAALATVTAQFVAAVGVTIYALKSNPYFKVTKENAIWERALIYKCIKTGLPIAAQYSLISFSVIALQVIVNGFGEDAVAAYTAVNKVENIISQPYAALMTTLAVYCGQNIGARAKDRIFIGFKYGNYILITYTILIIPVIFIFGDQIMRIFVDDQTVIDIGANALKITSSFFLPLGIIYLTRGILNGVGDNIYAFLNGLAELVGRVLFGILLTYIFDLGLVGAFFTSGLTWFITALTGLYRYKKGKWRINN